jgi:hypothetical protein
VSRMYEMFSRGVILRDRCETRWSKHSVKGGDGGCGSIVDTRGLITDSPRRDLKM